MRDGRALAAARRSASPRRGRESRLVRDGVSRRPRTIRCGRRNFSPGCVEPDFAAAVGRDLALIHAPSAADPASGRVRERRDVRSDPHRALSARDRPRPSGACRALRRARADHAANKRALVHGDVSPKNILHGPHGPVFLDAECAWFGDPAFDLAFCLNHLLLKGARDGADRAPYASRLCRAGRRLSRRSRLGERPRRPRGARGRRCCRRCSWPGSTESRRSNT